MKPIPKEIKEKWDKLREHGDNLKIKKMTKINHVTIGKALNDGLATFDTIKKINRYYAKVEIIKQKLLKLEE